MANQEPNQPRHNKKEPIIENKRSREYPTRTLDPPITLVDRAKEIQTADESIRSHANSKLTLILKQIQSLQQEAKDILADAERDSQLHKIKCNFEKQIGQQIHLYEKENQEKYFSMLSPEEWGTPPHKYLGSYILRADRSFELVEEEQEPEKEAGSE